MMFFKLIKIILKSKHYNIASRTTKQNHQAKKLEKAIVLSSKKKPKVSQRHDTYVNICIYFEFSDYRVL